MKLLLFFIILSSQLLSQTIDFKNYKTLEAKGEIPEAFLGLAYEKYEQEKEEKISAEEKKRLKKAKTQFYLSNSYFMNELMSSGQVLFGDPLSIYVNKIAKNLLEKSNNTKLINDLKFFVIKSSESNAFATEQGYIFVTTGLLTQLQNSEELAFILAHEIAHIEKKHIIQSVIEKEELKKAYDRDNSQFKKIVKQLSSFSKEQELEADEEGLTIFKKAGYNLKSATNSLSVLQYSHLPFDEIKFPNNYFNHDYYKIPETTFANDIDKTVEDLSDIDDEYSSHPNIKTRKEALNKIIGKKKTSNANNVIDNEFTLIQKIARFENLNTNLLAGEYTKVVYEGFLLDRLYPNNIYIKSSIGKALYGLSKIRSYLSTENDDDLSDISEHYSGESKVLYDLFYSRISDIEASILAMKYLSQIENKELNRYKIDLALDITQKHKISLEDFNTKFATLDTLQLAKDTSINDDTEAWSNLSKIEKLERLNNKDKAKTELKDENYYYNAFINELKDSNFLNYFTEADKLEIFTTNNEEFEKLTYSEKLKSIKKRKKEMMKVEPQGLDEIIVLSPNYAHIRKYKKDDIKSEKKEIRYTEIIKECAEKVDLKTTILTSSEYKKNDIESFNDETKIKQWLSEYSTYIDFHMIPFTQNTINQITEKYGTSKILLTGITNNKKPKPFNVTFWYAYIIPYTAPFMIAYHIIPTYKNHYYSVILDTKTISFDMFHLNDLKVKNTEHLIKSQTYYTIYNIKKKGK